MPVIHVEQGQDWLDRYKQYKKKKWHQRISPMGWLMILCFIILVLVVVGGGGYLLVNYIIENGFDFNPLPAPAGAGGAGEFGGSLAPTGLKAIGK